MLGENKNIKDTPKDSIKDTSSVPLETVSERRPAVSTWRDVGASYTKANKLITALYMVTDIMDKDEPIRLKLRFLGVEILSDIGSLTRGDIKELNEKVTAVLSFLNIAFDMGMISEMNFGILRKEFIELKKTMDEMHKKNNFWLEDFMLQSSSKEDIYSVDINSIGHDVNRIQEKIASPFQKGHGARLGIQKGGTLMKTLESISEKHGHHFNNENFENLKNKRREEIISIIKEKKMKGIEGATITDIKNSAKGTLVSCGEKTLQRELVSMVSDNILYKTGSKRWSHYFLK